MLVPAPRLAALAAVLLAAAMPDGPARAADAEVKLPPTLVWTAYDLGSTGYSQAVGIGSAFKNRFGTNVRVLPGKNDVSRLAPLRDGKAEHSLTGSEATYAQEAMYLFGVKEWGPQPITQLIMAVSGGTSAVATAKDADIRTLKDLKGKRVAFVKGAASLQNSMRGMLAFAGLTWDDVVKVEVPGYAASIQAVVGANADAPSGPPHWARFRKIAASPRGLHFPPVPHDDAEGWKRLKDVLPFFFKAIATEGPALPPGGQEMASAAYPVLVTTPATSVDHNYNLTKAMVLFFPDYKDAAPGANGWALDRQRFADTLLPFNEGAIRYYKEIGAWTPEAQATHEANLKRQTLLHDLWTAYLAKAPADETAFRQGWMQVRAEALRQAGLPVIQEAWDLGS